MPRTWTEEQKKRQSELMKGRKRGRKATVVSIATPKRKLVHLTASLLRALPDKQLIKMVS